MKTKSLIVGLLGIATFALLGTSSALASSYVGVWCTVQMCPEGTWGLGSALLEDLCTRELEDRCNQAASQICAGTSVNWYNLGTATFNHRTAVDTTCNKAIAFRTTGNGNCNYECQAQEADSGDTESPCEWCSPLLIDLADNGFELTSGEDGVGFDIDADAVLDFIAWTSGTADDAFLALDRDGNGRIDSGAELFGGDTEQPVTDAPNGFAALREFDRVENGGNGDGILSWEDSIWPQLVLWTDESHDGVSQSSELASLAEAEVNVLFLDYKESERRDRYDNRYRYRSRALIHDPVRAVAVIDVFFVRWR